MTEILIYGIVGDELDGLDAKTLVPMISSGSDPLDIRINSPGGYVMEGLAIFNALARAKQAGRQVTTHIDGLAASMGSVIAMAGSQIVMADNALMMIHNPWDVAIGDAIALRAAADQLDLIRDQMVGIYAGVCGMDRADLVQMLNAETWMDAQTALDQKFVTSVSAASAAAACDVTAFGFRKAPESPRISALAMLGKPKAASPAPPRKETPMPDPGIEPATPPAPAPVALTPADVQAAVVAERERQTSIRALGTKHKLPGDFIDGLVGSDTTLAVAREKILDKLAEQSDAVGLGHNSPARVTEDARDKFRTGALNWLITKSGQKALIEKAAKKRGETIDLDPGEFRGVSNVQLAYHALEMAGLRPSARSDEAIVGCALTARGAITQTTSDFPVVLETAMHKIVQAAYTVAPDTWSRFCGTGSVTDFRPSNRYLLGTFGPLDTVNEAGEFKNKPIPDGSRQSISANTYGNIINLTRQALINDDMGVFEGQATALGRAAKLTIEVAVYALLNSNPTMSDGYALFSTQHGNLVATGSGGVPTPAAFSALRVAMGSQKDLSGNEFLDIMPAIWLGPLSLYDGASVINKSTYDPSAANKLQAPNPVQGMFSDMIGTPRLAGSAWYVFAEPGDAPVIEVVFLNGVTEPFLEQQMGWRVDGTEWKVRHDFGVGALNYRGGFMNAGA